MTGNAVEYLDRWRDDVKLVTFTSAALGTDLEVTGHPIATLFLSSDATDGTFIVYLEEVDGTNVRYVTEGVLRGLHRE